VLAWTRSGKDEHEEIGPVASALGAGRGGGAIHRRSRNPELEAAWSFFVFRLKGQRPVMACVLRRRW
jgi:hypothetical protein